MLGPMMPFVSADDRALTLAMIAVALLEHARIGDKLVRASRCAVWGCSAFAHTVCDLEGGWSWLCDEHVPAAERGVALWPSPPC